MAGKGDKPRRVNKDIFDENFELIFGKRAPFWAKKKKKKVRKKG